MGEESAIGWTDGTFNPWWGCQEVSPACDNCYAREWDARFGGEHWGAGVPRRFFDDKHWNGPLRWHRKMEKRIAAWEAGGRVGPKPRFLVFCASMADVFEKRLVVPDAYDIEPHRRRLWQLIRDTPHLTWLLLTKRPGNIGRMLPEDLHYADNIWLGTTIESPEFLWRAAKLAEYAWAKVRFVSMEPLLAETSIAEHLHAIDWVISGCESGDGARETPTAHYRKLRDECAEAGKPFFLKQAPVGAEGIEEGAGSKRKRDLRTGTDGMKRVHWIVGEPYLDGVQHVAWPEAA